MPVTIRPFMNKDTKNMQKICVDTSPAYTPEQTPLLLCLYCNYYIEQEPENCFVAADENDNAVGYVIVAQDEKKYREKYQKLYMDTLKTINPERHNILAEEFNQPLEYYTQYPAHLHIDISPSHQGQGLGPKLLDAALENLRNKNIPGIMLGVGDKNTGAIRFYERYGFTRLKALPGVIFYGYSLKNN